MRARLLGLRDSIPAADRERMDAELAARVRGLDVYREADTVLTYLSFGAEVDTRAVIRDAWSGGKRVALPRCIPGTRTMAWHAVRGFDGLVTSRFGVDEPADDPATLVDPLACGNAVALVPGLAFDPGGFRIGYGGGFYDVFLAGFPGATVGLCRECQLSRAPLPADAHDLPVRLVVTEARVLSAKAD